MTSCEDVQVLLALRPDDRSVTEERHVSAHLAVCAECAARAEAYAEQDRVIRSAPRVGLTPAQRDQLLSTIERKRRRHKMRSRLFTVVGATAAVITFVTLAFALKGMPPLTKRLVPGATPGADPTNAEEALWTYVDAARDADLAHRTTRILQRQPWSGGEVILFTYEDSFPDSAGRERRRVLGWVLVEPGSEQAGWTVVAAGNRERVHWPVDRSIPTPEDVPIYTFWLSEAEDGDGEPLNVIYGLWDSRLGDAPEAVTLTLARPLPSGSSPTDSSPGDSSPGDRSIEISLENDSFLYVADESLTKKRPKISYGCDPPGGGRCGVAVYTDRPFSVEPLVFAGQIRSQNRAVDPLIGRLEPYTLGQPDPADRFAPGHLFTPAEVHFSLHWQVVSPPSNDWRVFVHLFREETGELALQSDARVDWPDQLCEIGNYGEACAASSQHDWVFPADVPPGLYTIEVGLYDPESGERAPVTSPSEMVGETSAVLGQVRIVSEDEGFASGDAERELARMFVDDPDGECGWEVLGEDDMQSYVWAICQSPAGTAVSAPAVLYWEAGKETVAKIQMPRDGSLYGEDVRVLFPPKVQERILDHDVDMDAIWQQIERDLTAVTGTVVDNAASAEVVTLEDDDGKPWHIPWHAGDAVRRSDGSRAEFRDLERGMTVEVIGFPRPEAATPNVLAAARVTILSEPNPGASLKDLLLRRDQLPGSPLDDADVDDWKPTALPLPGVQHEEDLVGNLARQDGCVGAFKVEGPRGTEQGDDSSAVVYVMNAVYQFETPSQASREHEVLLARMAREAPAPLETLYDGAAEGGMGARAVRFVGSEGDAVYWLFGVKEEYVHLLMVNGVDDDATRAFFEATMAQVLTRRND